jgi:mannose-6-phosphate isomerase-like protein (cupin superfamily)
VHPTPSSIASSGASSCAGAAVRQERPWGWFETLASGEGYLVKRLCIHAGQRISLQRHRWRSEHWLVVGGDGLLECSGERRQAQPGTSLVIPLGAIHRASAGSADLLIVEVQRGERLCEDDIERLADDFGRAAQALTALD